MTEATEVVEPPAPEAAPPAGPSGRKKGSWFTRLAARMGAQGARIILLAAIVALSGMALGYALGYPLRYVDYRASSAIQLDQAALAGKVEVAKSLVAAEDLGSGWAPGNAALGSFGVLGADVCGNPIKTPTPLSAKEAAVFTNEANKATVIAQALRVDQWKSAEEYIGNVADQLDKCETFYRVDGDKRVKVTSRKSDREPPVDDHIARTYQSADGVQEWSMMAVGDVIIAIQYLGPTPPPEKLLSDLERAVLTRVDPTDFAPGGAAVGGAGSTTAPGQTTVAPAAQSGGAADETGTKPGP